MAKRTDKALRAVQYLRKSTAGKSGDGGEKQARSIAQQRDEIARLAESRGIEVVREYADPGVSGWKREAARPGFASMLADAERLRDVDVVLVDDLDRFSRASYRKALADIDSLARAGVRSIVVSNGDEYRIDDETDAGEAHRLVACAMAAHEYSRKLSRRVAITRRNEARNGNRTGGLAPFGYVPDPADKHKLILGDPQSVETVRAIFRAFVVEKLSINRITSDLVKRKVPGPRGPSWTNTAVSEMLRRPVYCGDFAYARVSVGAFSRVDAEGNVVDVSKADGAPQTIVVKGAVPAIVDRKTWDAAQKRLAARAADKGSQKRGGYVLSGILHCLHCNGPMHGVTMKGRRPVYRGSAPQGGPAALAEDDPRRYCGLRQIREDEALAFAAQRIGESVADLRKILSAPPPELTDGPARRKGEADRLKKERDALAKKIDMAEDRILSTDDERTRRSLDAKVTSMRDELDALDAKLNGPVDSSRCFNRAELDALERWWRDYEAAAVTIPVVKGDDVGGFYQDPYEEGPAVLANPRLVLELLTELGCRIDVRWKTVDVPTSSGRTMHRHTVDRMRWRLGCFRDRTSGRVKAAYVVRSTGRRDCGSPPVPSSRAGRRGRSRSA